MRRASLNDCWSLPPPGSSLSPPNIAAKTSGTRRLRNGGGTNEQGEGAQGDSESRPLILNQVSRGRVPPPSPTGTASAQMTHRHGGSACRGRPQPAHGISQLSAGGRVGLSERLPFWHFGASFGKQGGSRVRPQPLRAASLTRRSRSGHRAPRPRGSVARQRPKRCRRRHGTRRGAARAPALTDANCQLVVGVLKPLTKGAT